MNARGSGGNLTILPIDTSLLRYLEMTEGTFEGML